jgi:hypothetical protein
MKDANNQAPDGAREDQQRRPGEGPPPGLADRLEVLRSLYAARGMERADQNRTDATHPVSKRALSILVVARLRELRALDELARYLQRGQLGPAKAAPPGPTTPEPLT